MPSKDPDLAMRKRIREHFIKQGVEEYLQFRQNQGELMFLRLNSGQFPITSEALSRVVRGCPAGTSDFFVLAPDPSRPGIARSIFLETKRPIGGIQTQAQKDFERMVVGLGGEYYLITDADAVEGVINGNR